MAPQSGSKTAKHVASLMFCLALDQGCQTARSVAISTEPGRPFAALRRGDDVVLTLRSGEVLEIEVGAIEESAVVDHKGRRYESEDVVAVQAERLDPGKTTALIVLCVAAAAVGAVILQALEPVIVNAP